MFKRDKISSEVVPGSVFECRHRLFNSVEVAEVLSVDDDCSGIPHVRFQHSYRCSNREDDQGVRVLAVKAFARRFHPVDAAA